MLAIENSRDSVPFTDAEIEAMQAFGRAPVPCDLHFVPKPEELGVAEQVTKALIHGISIPGLTPLACDTFMYAAEAMMEAGEITSDMFIRVYQAFTETHPKIIKGFDPKNLRATIMFDE